MSFWAPNGSDPPANLPDPCTGLISGYIASRTLRGIEHCLPAYPASSDSPEAKAVLQAWNTLHSNYHPPLVRFFRGWKEQSTQDDDLKNVLGGLKRYTLPLSAELSHNIIYEAKSCIPNLDYKISQLLKSPPFEAFGPEDALVVAMSRWFKDDYMRWIDPILCPTCGGVTQSVGGAQPDNFEALDGAGRVELHGCVKEGCGGRRRFARYGSISALLRTREGRCGEWAHLFYVFLRIAGVEARYVWNSEDHVWTEYWSPSLQHWVHVDSCEAAVNKPLLYANGWGKKQAFCIAIGPQGAEDVTRAYVNDWSGACQGRRRARGWRERALRRALLAQTIALRLEMDEERRAILESMDDMQQLWMDDELGRLAEAEREELGGRVSGSADWRALRDELGSNTIVKPAIKVLRTLDAKALDFFGDAKASEHGVILTSGPSQTSATFCSDLSIAQTQSFRLTVNFRLSAPPGSGEADGIAILFSSEAKLGLGGYGLGYSGVGGPGDYAIEVDTYRTRDHADDPPTPHISVHSPPIAHHRHSITCTPPNSIPYLSDGRIYALDLLYFGNKRRLMGWLRLPVEPGETESIEIGVVDVEIPQGEGKDWKIGFTGACGGLWQKQEILDWNLQFIEIIE